MRTIAWQVGLTLACPFPESCPTLIHSILQKACSASVTCLGAVAGSQGGGPPAGLGILGSAETAVGLGEENATVCGVEERAGQTLRGREVQDKLSGQPCSLLCSSRWVDLLSSEQKPLMIGTKTNRPMEQERGSE